MADVLIIEDSPLVIQMLTMVCQAEGHDVKSCERFDEISAAVASGAPDLIITDLNLPDAPDGDIVGEIRSLPGLSHAPIIIISGRPRQELETIAEETGAQAALSKDDGMPVISSQLPDLISDLTG